MDLFRCFEFFCEHFDLSEEAERLVENVIEYVAVRDYDKERTKDLLKKFFHGVFCLTDDEYETIAGYIVG